MDELNILALRSKQLVGFRNVFERELAEHFSMLIDNDKIIEIAIGGEHGHLVIKVDIHDEITIKVALYDGGSRDALLVSKWMATIPIYCDEEQS